MKKYVLYSLLFISSLSAQAQTDTEADVQMVSRIFEEVLTNGSEYEWLRYLCKNVGARIAGSPEGAAAVEYTSNMLDTIGVDSVWLQAVEVDYWRRGTVEKASVINSQLMGTVPLSVAALGFSAATPELGIVGEVIEVRELDDLEKLGKDKIQGKIVFFNKPMDITKINTFHAYGNSGWQRTQGPQRAAELGAIGAIVRSLTVKYDDTPHSGVTLFKEIKPIPAVGIGLKSADLLSALLQKEPNAKVNITLGCANLGKRTTYNVIGEIRGSKYPDQIIAVGGHLDSWDIGEGAHDDGAGCVHSMQVLQTFLRLGIRPQHTLRCVLFANEENGLRGATVYADEAKRKGEKHLAALESDAGGHTPRGFSIDAETGILEKSHKRAQQWRSLLAPYGFYEMETGGSGADISRLKSHGAVLFGYRPDSQRYFDYHHTVNDTFENVHKRELDLGAAGITALIYLMDKYGFK